MMHIGFYFILFSLLLTANAFVLHVPASTHSILTTSTVYAKREPHCKVLVSNRISEKPHLLKLSSKPPADSTPSDESSSELVEISVEELTQLLQASGVQPNPTNTADSDTSLSSFLASPQAKDLMEAMAQQAAAGPGDALSAAAALPFLGKGDPGGPLRKSAAAGDLPGIQKALDAAVWVTPSPARPGSPLCLRSRPPPKPPARAIARRHTTIAEHDMHVRGKLCGASTLAVHARSFAGAAWCPPPARLCARTAPHRSAHARAVRPAHERSVRVSPPRTVSAA